MATLLAALMVGEGGRAASLAVGLRLVQRKGSSAPAMPTTGRGHRRGSGGRGERHQGPWTQKRHHKPCHTKGRKSPAQAGTSWRDQARPGQSPPRARSGRAGGGSGSPGLEPGCPRWGGSAGGRQDHNDQPQSPTVSLGTTQRTADSAGCRPHRPGQAVAAAAPPPGRQSPARPLHPTVSVFPTKRRLRSGLAQSYIRFPLPGLSRELSDRNPTKPPFLQLITAFRGHGCGTPGSLKGTGQTREHHVLRCC